MSGGDAYCGSISMLKTPGMSLSIHRGQVRFLSLIVQRAVGAVDKGIARHIAEHLLQRTQIRPEGNRSLSDMFKEFDKKEIGDEISFRVYRSFLETLNDYIFPIGFINTHKACFAKRLLKNDGKTTAATCWTPILVQKTPDERLAWALQQARRFDKEDAKRRSANKRKLIASGSKGMVPDGLPLRYRPGKSYGGMSFVTYPYFGFPQHQVWMTADYKLYRINERECLLDAFWRGVVKSAPFVELVFTVVNVIGGAVAVGVIASGKEAIAAWVLTDIPRATTLVVQGAEVTISVITGTDMGPVSVMDQLEFLVISGSKAAARGAIQKVTTEVTEQAIRQKNGRRIIKGIVREAAIAGSNELKVFKKGAKSLAVFASRRQAVVKSVGVVASKSQRTPAARAIPILMLSSRRWLQQLIVRKQIPERMQSVIRVLASPKAGENPFYARLIEAIERFKGCSNFGQVLTEACIGTKAQQDGARFVIDFAMNIISKEDAVKKAIAFEMKSGMPGAWRRVDLFVAGVRYELKSVMKITKSMVKGRRKTAFGQVVKDLIMALGPNEKSALANAKRVKWVFNAKKLLGKVTAKEIKEAEKEIQALIMAWLRESEPFKGWKRLNELEQALKDMVVLHTPSL